MVDGPIIMRNILNLPCVTILFSEIQYVNLFSFLIDLLHNKLKLTGVLLGVVKKWKFYIDML